MDLCGVLADDELLQFTDRRLGGTDESIERAFTQADQAGVGVDLYEQQVLPAGAHRVSFDSRDLHGRAAPLVVSINIEGGDRKVEAAGLDILDAGCDQSDNVRAARRKAAFEDDGVGDRIAVIAVQIDVPLTDSIDVDLRLTTGVAQVADDAYGATIE